MAGSERAVEGEHLARQSHPNKEEAKESAKSKQAAMDRSTRTLKMTIMGRTDISAEMNIRPVGVRARIDDTWRVKTATHTITPEGYRTEIDAEKPGQKKGGGSSSESADGDGETEE